MRSRSLGPALMALGVVIICLPAALSVLFSLGPAWWLIIGGSCVLLGAIVSIFEPLATPS